MKQLFVFSILALTSCEIQKEQQTCLNENHTRKLHATVWREQNNSMYVVFHENGFRYDVYFSIEPPVGECYKVRTAKYTEGDGIVRIGDVDYIYTLKGDTLRRYLQASSLILQEVLIVTTVSFDTLTYCLGSENPF
ncbi:hypothetical protein L6Q79_06025 [bacterium]|nr:hypothetical protein [bacterium]NUN44413.1 hypothetical protein [bacterium]